MDTRNPLHINNGILIFIVIVISILQIYYFIDQEMNIYVWDYTAYWNTWIYYTNNYDYFYQILPSIIRSIAQSAEYNDSPILLLWLSKYLPFSMRVNYILGIYLLIYLPIVYLLFVIIKQIYKEIFNHVRQNIFICLLCFYPPLWMPILRGYLDIIGIIPVLLAIIFCIKNDLSNDKPLYIVRNIFMLTLLLWFPIILRRWYIFSVLALYICLPFLNIFLYQNFSFRKIVITVALFILSGVFMVFCIIFAQNAFFIALIMNNYSQIYSAYSEPFYSSYISIYNKVGLLVLFLFLVGCYSAAKRSISSHITVFNIFCLAMLLVSFNTFIYIQTMGLHHASIFSIFIFLTFWSGCIYVDEKLKSLGLSKYLTFILVWFAIFYITFNESRIRPKALISEELILVKKLSVLPEFKFPLYIDDAYIEEYLSLIDVLQKNVKRNENIVVLGSNQALTSSVLLKLSNFQLPVKSIAHIDFRDEIDLDTLRSDYVVVTDPPLIHRINYQCVVTIPSIQFLEHRGIGKAYKRLSDSFKLDDNTVAYIYEKEREINMVDIDVLLKDLSKCHPFEWNDTYIQKLKEQWHQRI